MKALFLAFLLLSHPALADAFREGNAAYAAGKFAEARTAYERALSEGGGASVWFNHGNASFRLEEPGRAALAYERALLGQPTHPEAAANLKFVRNKTAARVAEPAWKEKTWRFAAQPAASWIVVAFAWIGYGLIAVAIFRGRRRLLLALGILAVMLGGAAIAVLQMSRADFGKWAIIVHDRADARTEPADRSALAESLPAGSRVQVLSEQGDWTYCALPNGGRGWIPANTIERIIPHS